MDYKRRLPKKTVISIIETIQFDFINGNVGIGTNQPGKVLLPGNFKILCIIGL